MKLCILKWDILIPDSDKAIPYKNRLIVGWQGAQRLFYEGSAYLSCENRDET